jgi:hypothetical protein
VTLEQPLAGLAGTLDLPPHFGVQHGVQSSAEVCADGRQKLVVRDVEHLIGKFHACRNNEFAVLVPVRLNSNVIDRHGLQSTQEAA